MFMHVTGGRGWGEDMGVEDRESMKGSLVGEVASALVGMVSSRLLSHSTQEVVT